jgi:hypothetical protein
MNECRGTKTMNNFWSLILLGTIFFTTYLYAVEGIPNSNIVQIYEICLMYYVFPTKAGMEFCIKATLNMF